MKTILLTLVFATLSMTAAHAARDMISTDVLTTESMTKPTLAGGGSVTVGGDTMDERLMTGWFYGNDPIKTCYNHLESFGVTEAVASTALRDAVGIWQKYVKAKDLASAKGGRALNSNFQVSGKCKGDEDLVIHFGTGPIFGNMRELKASGGLHNPVAYVNKTHFAKDASWSKGYIRFVPKGYYATEGIPDWNVKDSLKIMLVHELGHVMGFIHEPNTVMDGAVVHKVFMLKDKGFTAEVDQAQDLVTCGACDARFEMLKTSVTPAPAQKFLQRVGFSLSQPILLTKDGGAFALSQGSKRVELERVKETVTDRRAVLYVNFPEGVRRDKESIVWTGTLQGTAVMLIYNGNTAEARGILQLHVLNAAEDAAVLDFARSAK